MVEEVREAFVLGIAGKGDRPANCFVVVLQRFFKPAEGEKSIAPFAVEGGIRSILRDRFGEAFDGLLIFTGAQSQFTCRPTTDGTSRIRQGEELPGRMDT